MRICVVGLGYVGLPQAKLLHESGFEVVGYDIDPMKQKLNVSFPVFSELPKADIYIVCVPTPILNISVSVPLSSGSRLRQIALAFVKVSETFQSPYHREVDCDQGSKQLRVLQW